MTLKINRVAYSLRDLVCVKVGRNPLKDVDFRVFTRILRKDEWTERRKDGRTDGSVTISFRNFVGEGIINVREHRRPNKKKWAIQRNWQHWAHKTQDEDKQQITHHYMQ